MKPEKMTPQALKNARLIADGLNADGDSTVHRLLGHIAALEYERHEAGVALDSALSDATRLLAERDALREQVAQARAGGERLADGLATAADDAARCRAEATTLRERVREEERRVEQWAGRATIAERASEELHERVRTLEAEVKDFGERRQILVDQYEAAEHDVDRLTADRDEVVALVEATAQELAVMRNERDSLRERVDELKAAHAEEIERWQDASGLECGGDPGGVTPEGLAKYREELERELDARRQEVQTLDKHWLTKFAAETARAEHDKARAMAAEERVRTLEEMNTEEQRKRGLAETAVARSLQVAKAAEARLSAILQRAEDVAGFFRASGGVGTAGWLERGLAWVMGEDATGAENKRHAVTDTGDCATWCLECRTNIAAGKNPDGTSSAPTTADTCPHCGNPTNWRDAHLCVRREPSTAAAFASVREGIRCARNCEALPNCCCGAEEARAALTLLKRRMAKMVRAGEEASSALNDGARLLSLALCGELTSQEHISATMRYMEAKGRAMLAALADAPERQS